VVLVMILQTLTGAHSAGYEFACGRGQSGEIAAETY
jgi:hypothetical protein